MHKNFSRYYFSTKNDLILPKAYDINAQWAQLSHSCIYQIIPLTKYFIDHNVPLIYK